MSAPSKTCWSARWPLRPGPLRPPLRRSRLRAPLAALACAALAGSGCISLSAHNREVDNLRGQVAQAEEEARDKQRSIEAMEEERQKLLDEIESLRATRTSLEGEVKDRDQTLVKLRGTYDALVRDLEAEVAAGELHIERL